MNRQQFEHVIRAVAAATGIDEVVVIGSQAILGTIPSAPDDMLISMEVDVFARGQPVISDIVDGAVGDGSQFHETFGYYAHGVGEETAVAPAGWMDRLVKVEIDRNVGIPGTVTALCMEPHDLVLAKLAAGRDHDIEFAQLALQLGVVGMSTLVSMVELMPANLRPVVRSLLKLAGADRDDR